MRKLYIFILILLIVLYFSFKSERFQLVPSITTQYVPFTVPDKLNTYCDNTNNRARMINVHNLPIQDNKNSCITYILNNTKEYNPTVSSTSLGNICYYEADFPIQSCYNKNSYTVTGTLGVNYTTEPCGLIPRQTVPCPCLTTPWVDDPNYPSCKTTQLSSTAYVGPESVRQTRQISSGLLSCTGAIQTVNCPCIYSSTWVDDRKGRKIRIQQTTAQALNLAEIQVFRPDGTEIKTGLTATLSSTLSSYPASNCLDGNRNTFCHGAGANDWLEIDLGSDQEIGRIVITNRQDGYQDRIVGATMRIFNSAGTEIWYDKIQHIEGVYTYNIGINGIIKLQKQPVVAGPMTACSNAEPKRLVYLVDGIFQPMSARYNEYINFQFETRTNNGKLRTKDNVCGSNDRRCSVNEQCVNNTCTIFQSNPGFNSPYHGECYGNIIRNQYGECNYSYSSAFR
jgi:hypothetical protein